MGRIDTPAIEALNLAKTYPNDVQALSGVDLTVKAGTIHGLLGPNGAGKSTMVKILTTLSRPTSGSAVVAGLTSPAGRPTSAARSATWGRSRPSTPTQPVAKISGCRVGSSACRSRSSRAGQGNSSSATS